MIRSLIRSCFLINLSFAFLLVSSVVSVLFIFSLLGKTNSQPLFCLPPRVFDCVCFAHILTPKQDKLSAKATKCIFLGYSRLHRSYQCYSPNINCFFISADVTFFEDSSATRPPVSDVLSISLVLPSPDFPSPPTDVVIRLLQVYNSLPRPLIEPLANSSSIPSSSRALVPQPPDDLPIALWKGTRCTCYLHPIYNFLSFHRLSLPYFVFVSTLSSISTTKSTSEALSHPS